MQQLAIDPKSIKALESILEPYQIKSSAGDKYTDDETFIRSLCEFVAEISSNPDYHGFFNNDTLDLNSDTLITYHPNGKDSTFDGSVVLKKGEHLLLNIKVIDKDVFMLILYNHQGDHDTQGVLLKYNYGLAKRGGWINEYLVDESGKNIDGTSQVHYTETVNGTVELDEKGNWRDADATGMVPIRIRKEMVKSFQTYS